MQGVPRTVTALPRAEMTAHEKGWLQSHLYRGWMPEAGLILWRGRHPATSLDSCPWRPRVTAGSSRRRAARCRYRRSRVERVPEEHDVCRLVRVDDRHPVNGAARGVLRLRDRRVGSPRSPMDPNGEAVIDL